MRRFCILLSLALANLGLFAAAPTARADAPPRASDAATRGKIFDDLFAKLGRAPDEASAAQIRALIERVWAHSGSPTADLLMTRAESALKAGKPAPAAALLDRIVSLYPDWSLGWRRRAQSALSQGDSEGAMLDFNRALQAEPRDFLAMGELAELLRATKQDRPALELMRRALALDPHNESLREEAEQLQRQIEGRDI
ncbi:tetratricopeptide repeat protein [Rhodoblastus sp.]|uniref:tetratricopeptide repeat protein n=1 Tax=Rhodoblastus sp. TaxID=1962975 RepID=UPI003F99EB2A